MHCRVAKEGARERALTGGLAAVPAGLPAITEAGLEARAEPVVPRPDPRLSHQRPLQGAGVLRGEDAGSAALGRRGITVAVVDTGADLGHPDLAPNLRVHPDERAGNGIDDGAIGAADVVRGTRLVDGDGDPADTRVPFVSTR